MQGRRIQPPDDQAIALLVGPGVGEGEAEVATLANLYQNAELLTGGFATAEKVLTVLEGRSLAHIAARGSFRADNPLFSSIMMHDGPLTVHDLQQLRHAPYRLVLSARDFGVTASAGGDEILRLVGALSQLGTVGVLAPVVPVNDRVNVPLVMALHAQLARGGTTAEALRHARLNVHSDPISFAATRAYVAFGAA